MKEEEISLPEEIKFVFVSNYLNHHQIPFCNAMSKIMKGSFAFIQTEAMEEERIRMGWDEKTKMSYMRLFYEEPENCRQLIEKAEVVLFGGSDEESYIESRLETGKPVIRYSERLYKTGQWKAVSPRGLRKKFHDHTKYRNSPVYLLCAGAYAASDFHIVKAYPEKMFCWGYFPETRHYDVDKLLADKGWYTEENNPEVIPSILWAARMIAWKHPELPMETAAYLKAKGLSFHMNIIGGGEKKEQLENMRRRYGLEDCVSLPGFMTPEQVRSYMEKADIFLFTSDRQEGWGAVANEAMNSGCALVADHMIGAVPYLVRHGDNGLIYKDGEKEQLFELTEQLVRDKDLCRRIGRNAYYTITETWNAEHAAERLAELCVKLGVLQAKDMEITDYDGKNDRYDKNMDASAEKRCDSCKMGLSPCAPAPVIHEQGAYRRVTGKSAYTEI